MNITKISFKIKERLDGSKITEHYIDIKDHIESNKDLSSIALDHLLLHVKKNVPYYRANDFENLNHFPIVNKSIIRSNFTEFRAINFRERDLIKMTTSGSTGTPFTIYQDKNKKSRNYADALYFGNKGGYHLGNKLVYLKIWLKDKMHHSLQYKLQNISTIDVKNLTDAKIKKLIKEFKNKSHEVHSVLGYVSALEQIIRYCEKHHINDLHCKFSGVITMAEGLSSVTRGKLQKLFKCQVVSRYSNLENGIIAQQEIDSDDFLVNTASYFVEIFHPEHDEPIEDGYLGRIVLTDLYNFATPIIRYDTGDMGIKVKRDGKTFLTTVEGRKADIIFNTSGEITSTYIVPTTIWNYLEIEQFQLLQVGEKSYVFKINCPRGFTKEKQLVNEFKAHLGMDAEFKFIYVDGIPLLNSGKHRQTVNLHVKNSD
ncbi:CoF synthetase [Gelidibacter sp.]|uniref:CoF synthetase n=1 Tax=Gelidibacter sp. TaxID=2018083 RepID=UPI0032651FA8